jgi:14-3-3 protein epsilon
MSMEERNLLSIAYKHVTGTLRTSWRTVESIEKQETATGRAMLREQALIRRQREKIELELADACRDLLDLLDRHLVPAAEAGEERVFYLKMHVFLFFFPTLFSPVFLIYMRMLVAGLAYSGRAIIIGTLQNLLDIRSESRLRS